MKKIKLIIVKERSITCRYQNIKISMLNDIKTFVHTTSIRDFYYSSIIAFLKLRNLK